MMNEHTPTRQTYDPKAVEARWYEVCTSQGYWSTPRRPIPGQPYLHRDSPPITGSLHVGHALIIRSRHPDTLATHARPQCSRLPARTMLDCHAERSWKSSSWPRRFSGSLGRERFIERVWQWKTTFGIHDRQPTEQLGESCDGTVCDSRWMRGYRRPWSKCSFDSTRMG